MNAYLRWGREGEFYFFLNGQTLDFCEFVLFFFQQSADKTIYGIMRDRDKKRECPSTLYSIGRRVEVSVQQSSECGEKVYRLD